MSANERELDAQRKDVEPEISSAAAESSVNQKWIAELSNTTQQRTDSTTTRHDNDAASKYLNNKFELSGELKNADKASASQNEKQNPENHSVGAAAYLKHLTSAEKDWIKTHGKGSLNDFHGFFPHQKDEEMARKAAETQRPKDYLSNLSSAEKAWRNEHGKGTLNQFRGFFPHQKDELQNKSQEK